MKVVLEDASLLVVDEFLAPDVFAAISDAVGNGEYHSVHSKGWDRSWRMWDGAPLRGRAVHYDPQGRLPAGPIIYPTRSAVDVLIDMIRDLARTYSSIAGTEGVDWYGMFMSPWLYPVGSALSLHRDGGRYSGAFTYFTHPSWGMHWGGELFVLDGGQASAPATSLPEVHGAGWLFDDSENLNASSGIATCVFPRPNRLVLLGPARPHMIRRIDTNAGTHVRASLAGFFLRQ